MRLFSYYVETMSTSPNSAYYVVFQGKTAFMRLKDVYPECSLLIEGEPQLGELLCLSGPCHRNQNCMTILAHRVHQIFDEVIPDSELLYLYFRAQNRKESIQAGVFWRSMKEPRVIVCNPWAFKKFMTEGDVHEWTPGTDFYLKNVGQGLLPASSLIKKLDD